MSLVGRLEETARRTDEYLARVDAFFAECSREITRVGHRFADMELLAELDTLEHKSGTEITTIEDLITASAQRLQLSLARLQGEAANISAVALATLGNVDAWPSEGKLNELDGLLDLSVPALPQPPGMEREEGN